MGTIHSRSQASHLFRWLSLVGLRRQAMNNREETELAQPAINLPIELVIGSFYVTGATSNDDL